MVTKKCKAHKVFDSLESQFKEMWDNPPSPFNLDSLTNSDEVDNLVRDAMERIEKASPIEFSREVRKVVRKHIYDHIVKYKGVTYRERGDQ